MSTPDRLRNTTSTVLSDDVYDRVAAEAEAGGESISAYIRRTLTAATEPAESEPGDLGRLSS